MRRKASEMKSGSPDWTTLEHSLSEMPGMAISVEIRHLCDYPEHLRTVARWIHEEWWSDKPGHTVETMAFELQIDIP